MARIIYTHTDESPMLATASLLPIIEGFAKQANITIETADISLSGRILAAFNDQLPETMRVPEALQYLAKLTNDPSANIIKLPNISASLPQLKAAIGELQSHGYPLPDYPDEPRNATEAETRRRYDTVKGSAVNPVLREGNSDRRAPLAVKNYAKAHPHKMGQWDKNSQTRVATMESGDFRSSEKSTVIEADGKVQLVLKTAAESITLHANIPVQAGEIFDLAKMSRSALVDFLTTQVATARAAGVLFSTHLKATMMKVSDPIIFGHVVEAYFADVFSQYGAQLAAANLHARDGLATIFAGLQNLPEGAEIRRAFDTALAAGAGLAMVDSSRGITNLHVPSDVIVDASMPAMIRNSGKMWNRDGKLQDTLAVIPDSSYADVYQTVISDCKKHGAFDPVTMGSVANIGLMAQKAEEYGSHDKTFEIAQAGHVELQTADGSTLLKIAVAAGDIIRGCQTKDAPVRDWVALAVRRARQTNTPAIFWLDPTRAHDSLLAAKVRQYLQAENTDGLEIQILSPQAATQLSIDRIRKGLNTISVTGNVLRDYLTDLFPILELGTSAKMLSVVPLMAGGGLFETGAGGSAPKHVKQLIQENHLRWDSLGEFLAIAESFRQFAQCHAHTDAGILADALDHATERLLTQGKSPQRQTGTPDNRNSHAWLAIWWAENLARQTRSLELAAKFAPFAKRLRENAQQIESELLAVQGKPVNIGGYYHPDPQLLSAVMRPAKTLNTIVDEMRG
ncbi:NADP-dependent isocitrate dehydrogenase [Arcanobacterium hippocoleae]|uniref:Isocitrate dehydrogenase [NADP] n=1 Tax=Arcanobacterium hippocoleae TaxID=149017 RepID=A0ABU1T3Q4_9ACTO|nr:NADP-dependent isocitrate dehydrogenase [Arcanobacterium hippocoleae]MDR6939934.1 isocitrate dehydrogenase [Arcanobacterium hippocoleae]